jgi:hypothetical protein
MGLTFALGLVYPECLDHIVERDFNASSTTSQRIHDLVARYCGNPWRYRRAGHPRISLQVKRQQNFLDNVLRVQSRCAGSPAYHISHGHGEQHE